MSFMSPPCAQNAASGKVKIPVTRRKIATAPAAPVVPVVRDFLLVSRMPAIIQSWASDLSAAGASDRYTSDVSDLLNKCVWWMRRENIPHFDSDAARGFLIYVQNAWQLPEGRWGEKGQTRTDHEGKAGCAAFRRYAPISPNTVCDYHKHLTTLSNWAVKQGFLDVSPMLKVRKPMAAKSQGDMGFRRFTVEEFEAIKKAAKKMRYPLREYAIVLFLLDTGLRASELCALTWGDVDMTKREAIVRHGKGNKERRVHWSGETGRALWAHTAADGMDNPAAPVFTSKSGRSPGAALTRNGLGKILRTIGQKAELEHSSPHDFRRTFATFFMLNGGMQKPLMDLMGHENPIMTNRYVRLSGANLSEMAQKHSPVAYLKKKGRQSHND